MFVYMKYKIFNTYTSNKLLKNIAAIIVFLSFKALNFRDEINIFVVAVRLQSLE